MKSTNAWRRLAGTAVTAVMVGVGVLATAPSAAAKANLLTIDKVSFRDPNIQVKVTYSCDPGLDHELVANGTTLSTGTHREGIAAGTVKKDKLICDDGSHVAQVTMRPATGMNFVKGDKVKVTVFYFDNDGFSYANETTVVVL
ncbi:hypothetical protein A6P39_040070 [Streptomyces sp. FXJ1.172]|jgi:hypothetical protein|uniref:hypothetical protein n=1 Tax=Streptomyces sp. FXJ1.172 TaxID=710705 RepID=UPI0007D02D72|nr:hypothetical protein [Streptomyces sp. FXJ1.172]WEO99749.1 hypothetical protein A6P39_040070 [Streptomyces sp. FXJ1.172]